MTAGRNQPRTLLVDLCGTLYDANTTFAFLPHVLGDDARYHRFVRATGSLYGRALNRILPGDRRRRRAISFLEGFERERLQRAASEFLQHTPVIEDVRQRVSALAREHDRTIVVSSSLDFIVEAASHRFDFVDDFIATRLEWDHDICTGRIQHDLLGRKHEEIERAFGGHWITMVTDNESDRACIGRVQQFIAVAPANQPKRARFWRRHAAEVIAWRQPASVAP